MFAFSLQISLVSVMSGSFFCQSFRSVSKICQSPSSFHSATSVLSQPVESESTRTQIELLRPRVRKEARTSQRTLNRNKNPDSLDRPAYLLLSSTLFNPRSTQLKSLERVEEMTQMDYKALGSAKKNVEYSIHDLSSSLRAFCVL